MTVAFVVNLDQLASEMGRFADIFLEQPELVSGQRHIAVKQVVGMDEPCP